MPEFFILIVEEDPQDLQHLKSAFPDSGVQGSVQFVRSVAEAMDYLLGISPYDKRNEHPFPNLLLIDLKLPRRDGFQLMAWLRKPPFMDHRLKVGVMSDSARQQDSSALVL